MARTCAILAAARFSGAEFILENPSDHGDPSNTYYFLDATHVPLWNLKEVQLLQVASDATLISFPMCELGHASQKLTTLMVTPGVIKQLSFLTDLRCSHKTHKPAGGETKNGKFTSSEAARYPKRMNKILAHAIACIRADDTPQTRLPKASTVTAGGIDGNAIMGTETYYDENNQEYEAVTVNPDLLLGP